MVAYVLSSVFSYSQSAVAAFKSGGWKDKFAWLAGGASCTMQERQQKK
jgi:hypothetical protein